MPTHNRTAVHSLEYMIRSARLNSRRVDIYTVNDRVKKFKGRKMSIDEVHCDYWLYNVLTLWSRSEYPGQPPNRHRWIYICLEHYSQEEAVQEWHKDQQKYFNPAESGTCETLNRTHREAGRIRRNLCPNTVRQNLSLTFVFYSP